jgi:hypothetical protein
VDAAAYNYPAFDRYVGSGDEEPQLRRQARGRAAHA